MDTFNKNNNNNISDIKKVLMRFREYFSSPIAEKRMEMFSEMLNKEYFGPKDVSKGCKDLLLTKQHFPSLSEIIDASKKYRIMKFEQKEFQGCALCNHTGVHYRKKKDVDFCDFEYEYVYRCKCEKGRLQYPSFPLLAELSDR